MGRVKKGKRAQRKDLWAMAGGMEALVRGLKSVHITKRDTGHSSYIWSELAIILFGHDDKKHRHWLWVVWTNNRKGLRDLINKRQKSLEQKEVQVMEENQNERDVGGECSEDCLSKDLPLSMIQHKVSDEDIDKNEAEDKQQRMSSQSGLEDDQLSDEDIDKNEAEDKQQRMSSQSGLEDDQLSDEDIDKNEAEDKQQRMSSQSGLEDDQLSDEDIDKNEAEDKQQRMSSQSGLEDDQLSDEDIDKNEAEDKQQRMSSQSGLEDDQLSDEDIDKNEAEDKQQRMSSQSGLEDDQLSDEDIDKNEAEDKQQRMSSQSGLEDDQLSDEDIDKNEAETEEQNLQRGAQDVNKNTGTKTHWRKLPVVSKRFGITVNRKKWQKIVPLTGSNKLRQPWTDVLYKSFREKNPCCTLAFKSHHIKTPNSRKIKSPYLNICAVCTFPSCRAKFFFKIQNQPVGDTLVKIPVLQRGKMAHKANETKFRPAANRRRGRIARALHKGVSQVFYSKLKKNTCC
ncbi:uncharacterized protein LOC117548599 [Gymnodraco acuticeps]|uniref:Uncharacterized protein LOC117548599 n=1 Tax=Gymnodraco acuticeps TaxID=8218 RepID=A0A6P8UFJ3_GYMAC|nr:uncharacterized protein LOC117548599 [Gymnodraco acuticeps]